MNIFTINLIIFEKFCFQNYQNSCSNRGSPSGSGCSCQNTYFGDRCQYKNDCEEDKDCSYHGESAYFEKHLCHSYRLSFSNQANLTIFDKGKTLPWTPPRACKLACKVEQTGGHNFSKDEKNKKFNSSLSNQVHNSPFSSTLIKQERFNTGQDCSQGS